MARVAICSTVAAYKCEKGQERAWLEHAEEWSERHLFFCAVQVGHGHDERFADLLTLLAGIGAVVWEFSLWDHASSVNSSNRLTNICTGRNLAHEYVIRDASITHLLFLDSDVTPSFDAVERLLEVDHPLVGGNVPAYCQDGPKVDHPGDVREHWNTAGFLMLQREAVRKLRWGYDPDDGLTDDPYFARMAEDAGLGKTWVRHDVVGRHTSLRHLEARGHDLSIV